MDPESKIQRLEKGLDKIPATPLLVAWYAKVWFTKGLTTAFPPLTFPWIWVLLIRIHQLLILISGKTTQRNLIHGMFSRLRLILWEHWKVSICKGTTSKNITSSIHHLIITSSFWITSCLPFKFVIWWKAMFLITSVNNMATIVTVSAMKLLPLIVKPSPIEALLLKANNMNMCSRSITRWRWCWFNISGYNCLIVGRHSQSLLIIVFLYAHHLLKCLIVPTRLLPFMVNSHIETNIHIW